MRTRLGLSLALVLLIAGGVVLAVSSSSSPPPARAQAPATTGPTGPSAAQAKPNVVFVLTDDMSSDLLKYMPNVRKLEQQGTSFSNYVVSDSLCCPSRTSTFTGEVPHNDGVFTNMGKDGGYGAFQSHADVDKTYGVALQNAGYRTAMMGKYLNGYLPADGVPKGWDEWDVAGNGYPNFNYDLNQDGQIVHYGADPQDYLVDVLSGKGVSFIDSSVDQGKPFAMEIAPFTPHAPSTPAPRYVNALPNEKQPRVSSYGRANTDPPSWLRRVPPLTKANHTGLDKKFAKRARSLLAVDDMVGKLRSELQAKGVAQNTVFVFSSDNGFHLGQHNLRAGKQTAFDSDIRVPLIIAGPGVKAGAATSALAQNTDLAPTFEALGGQTPASTVDGRSLLPILQTGATPGDWRDAALVEHHGPDLNAKDPDHQPKAAGMPTTYEAIRTANATYVEYRDGEREYYDDRADPQQRHNVYKQLSAARKAQLHAQVTRLKACKGAKECATR